ncbi:putative quinol monooxygenase [Ensifer adhaerens]|uniref:putative quinol monooxygenase n=1 Tax=Ensifer adhaerens TaxID=106592 RepID=UPI00132EA70B|nr:antibiotic biosynthesis monooxygenase [Ensifer adhaerens]
MSKRTQAGPDGSEAIAKNEPHSDRAKRGFQLDRRSFGATLGGAAVAGIFGATSARAAQSVTLPKGAVTVVAYGRAQEGNSREFFAITEALVQKIRQEPGNLLCQIHRGLEEPNLLVFYEIFKSPQDLENHKSSSHVRQWALDVAPLISGPLEIKLVRAFG